MKDLSSVEIKKNDIVYYLGANSGDLEFGEVLEVAEDSAAIAPLRLVEDTFGQQELHRLPFDSVTTKSQMIFVLPDASQRLPIKELDVEVIY